jgi:hypothetical protein
VKSHFEDEERLRRNLFPKAKRDFGSKEKNFGERHSQGEASENIIGIKNNYKI